MEISPESNIKASNIHVWLTPRQSEYCLTVGMMPAFWHDASVFPKLSLWPEPESGRVTPWWDCRQKNFAVAADILPPKFCLQNVAVDILPPKTLLPPALKNLPPTSWPAVELTHSILIFYIFLFSISIYKTWTWFPCQILFYIKEH